MNRYWIKLVAPNNVANTILLAHLDNATNDYDAELLTVGDDSFYSKLNAQKLQIQVRTIHSLQAKDLTRTVSKSFTKATKFLEQIQPKNLISQCTERVRSS